MSDGLISQNGRVQHNDPAATACGSRAALEVGLGVRIHAESQTQGNTSEGASQLRSWSELHREEQCPHLNRTSVSPRP